MAGGNNKELPGAAGDLAQQHPSIWAAYAALGEATADAGGLTIRERRLIKLALAIGASSEGAVHSHSRRGISEGIDAADLHQVALLAIGPLGLPRAVAAGTWISDVTKEK
ncbi:carboxymuconolactone decarboxylase [Pelagivirga sediminicola]|uniref:Carboxymuconolactone decarboxylase n=1 Tax=Pelagivirga sediminicola TaxID=2170575 RepID=A0A2T7G2Z5_9RHOB|nr:carboxymuconolactone decarboxylase family protein [Pelagivirga sediminicola]PVA08770.1 carboxymuconolactone decarboxylase [Pelagivirga sediminicola]